VHVPSQWDRRAHAFTITASSCLACTSLGAPPPDPPTPQPASALCQRSSPTSYVRVVAEQPRLCCTDAPPGALQRVHSASTDLHHAWHAIHDQRCSWICSQVRHWHSHACVSKKRSWYQSHSVKIQLEAPACALRHRSPNCSIFQDTPRPGDRCSKRPHPGYPGWAGRAHLRSQSAPGAAGTCGPSVPGVSGSCGPCWQGQHMTTPHRLKAMRVGIVLGPCGSSTAVTVPYSNMLYYVSYTRRIACSPFSLFGMLRRTPLFTHAMQVAHRSSKAGKRRSAQLPQQ